MSSDIRSLLEPRWYIIPDQGAVTVMSGKATANVVLEKARKLLRESNRKDMSVRVTKDVSFLIKGKGAEESAKIPKTLFNVGVDEKVTRVSRYGNADTETVSSVIDPFSMIVGEEKSKGLGTITVSSLLGVAGVVLYCTPDGLDLSGNIVIKF